MGRGMIADVSAKLVREFVRSLETNVLAVPGSNGVSVPLAAVSPDAGMSEAAVDLTGAAGRAAARRLVPLVLVAALLLWVARRAHSWRR